MLIQGPIIAITPPDYTNQFGVQYQNITIQTVQGPVEGRIGTKKPYTEQDINQQGQWDCEISSNNQGAYNKFKKHFNKPYQGQVAPQNPQQAPSQPAQGTNYQQPATQGKKEPDWDAIAEGKVRHGILCAMLQGGISVDYPEVLRHTVFVMTGIDPDSVPDPHPSIQNNPIEAQFCDECRNLKEECTCKLSY